MTRFALLALVFPLVASFSIWHSVVDGPNDSGGGCAVCTVGLGFLKRIADYQQIPLEDLMEFACTILPEPYQHDCKEFVKLFGPLIIELFALDLSADEVCREIEVCKDWATCTLYGKKYRDVPSGVAPSSFFESSFHPKTGQQLFGDPVPPNVNDQDGDKFSTYFLDYGTAWRGKDCDDSNSRIYPGRKDNPTNSAIDFNCNGISGINPVSGRSWKEELCSTNVTRKGVAVIGDSACAHFRIPEQMLLANVTMDLLGYAIPLAQNQMDWPHLSMYGGYEKDTSGLTPGNVNSIYLQQRERNRCNHRDFATLCVNGCDSFDILDYGKTLTRDPTDHPIVLFLNLFGDDVCHHEHEFSKMTTPKRLRKNVDALLDFFDGNLPPGSEVVFVGLVNGTLLYKFLAHTMHPIGVTYEDVYNYLNCLNVCPCWGWLNENETIRELTQDHANALNEVFSQIAKEEKRSFGLYYVDSGAVLAEIVAETIAKGLSPTILAEPIDGFHPSQVTLPLFAEKMYARLLKENPDIFGGVNPNNDLIERLFGNQGGY